MIIIKNIKEYITDEDMKIIRNNGITFFFNQI